METKVVRKEIRITRITLAVLLGSLLLLVGLVVAGGVLAQPPEPPANSPEQEMAIMEAQAVAATVSSEINYQGVLKENGNPANGTYTVTFTFNANSICTDTLQTITETVPITNGLFSVELAPYNVDGRALWLGVNVGSTQIACQAILPVPYALSLKPGAVISGATFFNATGTLNVNNNSDGGCFGWPLNFCWPAGNAVSGYSKYGYGVEGTTGTGTGVYAEAITGTAVMGIGYGNGGVFTATQGTGTGVIGNGWTGVKGRATSAFGSGVYGEGNILNYGVYAYNDENIALYASSGGGSGDAIYTQGDADINGTLTKDAGAFKIDHPLDPANKYLYHSFVESPDMMNVYNGNAVVDENGEAWVELPDYFEALNKDFRYQLTPIGGPGPNLYIAEEIADNRFKIAGGDPGLKVSWQVTGVRQDPYAEANRIQVEVEKSEEERGYYRQPELYGQPDSKAVHSIQLQKMGEGP